MSTRVINKNGIKRLISSLKKYKKELPVSKAGKNFYIKIGTANNLNYNYDKNLEENKNSKKNHNNVIFNEKNTEVKSDSEIVFMLHEHETKLVLDEMIY